MTTLRILVPAPAGSSLDVLARAIGEKLKDKFGQPVVVDNKPAAGGTVATAETARAPADGSVILLGFNGPLATGPLIQKAPYDVQKDLVPVIITSSQPNVLASTPVPIKTLTERRLGEADGQAQLRLGRRGSVPHLNAGAEGDGRHRRGARAVQRLRPRCCRRCKARRR